MSYLAPIATTGTLGAVIIGSNIQVTPGGVISVTDAGTGPTGPTGTGGAIGVTGPTGPGSSSNRQYGYFYDTTTQRNLSATTANLITFNTVSISNGINLVNNRQVTFSQAGVYNIFIRVQPVRTGGSTTNVNFWMTLNGTNITQSNCQQSLSSNSVSVTVDWNLLLSVSAGDYVQVYWATANTDVQLVSTSSQTGPSIPATPCITLTATQA